MRRRSNNRSNVGCGLGRASTGADRPAGRWRFQALGVEGKFDTAGGVALIAGHALQAAVVIQVAGAGCAHTVQLSMGELCAFHVHLNLLCMPGWREGDKRKNKLRG